MGSQLQFSSKPQHYCTYCLAGYRCCSNCHSFRLLRSLSKKREKNRLNLIFHIFNDRCSVLPYGLVCCAFLILFFVFFVICSLRSVCFARLYYFIIKACVLQQWKEKIQWAVGNINRSVVGRFLRLWRGSSDTDASLTAGQKFAAILLRLSLRKLPKI